MSYSVKEYIEKLDEIRKKLFLNRYELAGYIGIDYNTLKRITLNPELEVYTSTYMKIKKFITKYEGTYDNTSKIRE